MVLTGFKKFRLNDVDNMGDITKRQELEVIKNKAQYISVVSTILRKKYIVN